MEKERTGGHGGKVAISASDVGKMMKLHGFPKWKRAKKFGPRRVKHTSEGVVTYHDPTSYVRHSGTQRPDSRPLRPPGTKRGNWHARARRVARRAARERRREREHYRLKAKERAALKQSGLEAN